MSVASVSSRAPRELLAVIFLLALLVRPRGCVSPGRDSYPVPANEVVERSGRLERAQPGEWRGHTAAAWRAEGAPYCWWALDAALLSKLPVPPATATKLLQHMEAGGRPDFDELRNQAGLPRPLAERWSRAFRVSCAGRDLHLDPESMQRR